MGRKILKGHNMVELFNSIILICLILICMYFMYRLGNNNGTHKERMRLLKILQQIPMKSGINNGYTVLEIVNYIIKRLKEE